MYLELLARIVLSSSTCQFVLHLLSLIFIYQFRCLSFCSRRVVSRLRQMRPHVDPPPAPQSRAPQVHPLHIFLLELFFLSVTRSVSATLSLYAFILAFPVKGLSIIVLIRSRHCSRVVLSLFRAMPELHNPDNVQCDREPRCRPTTRRIFLALPLEFFQL